MQDLKYSYCKFADDLTENVFVDTFFSGIGEDEVCFDDVLHEKLTNNTEDF